MKKVYDTVLSSPGMNEMIKVDLRINRKTILLLNQVINRGLNNRPQGQEYGLPEIAPEEIIQDLFQLAETCLQKGELTELSAKLNELQN